MTTYITTLTRITRLTNTRNGGPRYRLTTASGARLTTGADTADSFAWVPDRLTGREVTLTVNARGAVIGIDA